MSKLQSVQRESDRILTEMLTGVIDKILRGLRMEAEFFSRRKILLIFPYVGPGVVRQRQSAGKQRGSQHLTGWQEAPLTREAEARGHNAPSDFTITRAGFLHNDTSLYQTPGKQAL